MKTLRNGAEAVLAQVDWNAKSGADGTMDGINALDVIDTIRHPVLILDPDLRVIAANRAFFRFFRVGREETEGCLVYDLGEGQWDIPRLRELLHDVIPQSTIVEDFEVETWFPVLGHRIIALNAREVYRHGHHTHRVLLAFEDISDIRQRERDQAEAAAEVYHRVKNSLQMIMSFVYQEERRMIASEAAGSLAAVQGRIAAVAELYDLIARSETQDAAVKADAYLAGIATTLTASLLGPEARVTISVDAEPLAIDLDASVPLGLVVNELATNAIKHAFPAGKGGAIQIALKKSDNTVRLSISDNGVGLHATGAARPAAKPKGFGSVYIGMFVRQLGGTLTESSSPAGSAFDIRLPRTVLAA